MGLLRRFSDAFRAFSGRIVDRAGPPGDPSFFTPLRLLVDQPGDPYSTHAVVYRCITVLARGLSSVPLRLYTGDDEDKTETTAGAWYEVLLRPNPYMTRRLLWEAVATYMLSDGECFLILESATDRVIGPEEVPAEIWPYPGALVEEVLGPDQRTLDAWRLRSGKDSILLPPWAVVQPKFWNPKRPLRGLSPMAAAMAGFRQDALAAQWNEALFVNGADPGGILTSEQNLSADQRAELRKSWETRHQGAGKAHRTAVLGNGVKYQQLSVNHRDMQWLEGRRYSREEIAMVFGVPKWFLGVSDDLNYATAKSAERILWTSTLIPLARMIEDTLEAQLFSGRAARAGSVEWAEFDTSKVEALREDLDVKLTAAERLRNMGYPLNEINTRLELGMEEQEGGDVGLVAAGLTPIEEILALDEPEESGALPPLGEEEDPEEPTDDEDQASPEEEGVPDDEDDPDDAGRSRQDPGARRRAALWRLVARGVMDPSERRFRKRIRGYLQGRRAEVLRAAEALLRADASARALTIEQFLAQAKDRWDSLLKKQLGPLYRTTFKSGAESVGDQLGSLKVFDMGDPKVLAALAERELKVTGVNDTILGGLRETLLAGMGAAETVTELQDRIRQTFALAQSRSLTIARTEAASSVNTARQLAMEAEGVSKTEWLTSRDAHVRDEHALLDGQIRDLGQSFAPGVQLRYPGDPEAPPRQVVNCRCTSAPLT